MGQDKIFAGRQEQIQPFVFDKKIADVFDDMLHRSVPLYAESGCRQAQLAAAYYQEGSNIYDLGCSHGNLGIRILEQMEDRPFSMIGVDYSAPMIEKYSKRLETLKENSRVKLICRPMEDVTIENASVVLINLTLQFLNPEVRDELIKQIYAGMNQGGVLLLTEKTVHEQEILNNIQENFYKQFKLENGYSELEISQKRDALEKVLIPDTVQTHENRLKQAGFKTISIWLKWFNFTSMIAIK